MLLFFVAGDMLGGGMLLLVFALVNAAVLVLRRDPVDHEHLRTPSALPVLGGLVSVGLLTQQTGEDFLRAGAFLLVGLALWLLNRATGAGVPAPAGVGARSDTGA